MVTVGVVEYVIKTLAFASLSFALRDFMVPMENANKRVQITAEEIALVTPRDNAHRDVRQDIQEICVACHVRLIVVVTVPVPTWTENVHTDVTQDGKERSVTKVCLYYFLSKI